MIKHTRRFAGVLLACVGLSSPAIALAESPPATTTQSAAPANSASKLSELKSTIEQLKKELESVKSNRQSLLNDLEGSEKKIGELNQKVEELKKQLEAQHTSLNNLRSEQEALASAKKEQEGQVEQHVSAAYRLGNQSSLKLILNQQDPADLARNLKYFEYVIAARSRQIEQFNQTLIRLGELEPEIAAQTQALEASERVLEEQKQQLLSSSEERKRTIAKLQSTIDNKDQQLKGVEQDRKNLEEVMRKVVKTIAKYQPPEEPEPELELPSPVAKKPKPPTFEPMRKGNFAQQKGALPWPANGRLVNSFGSSRVAGKLSWEGIYIEGKMGDPVHAIFKGRVVFADYLRGQGLLMIVDHGGGYLSLYAHNQSLLKQTGDLVEAGQAIATLGNSGGQASAGLYFELRYNQQPTDPKPWLRKAA